MLSFPTDYSNSLKVATKLAKEQRERVRGSTREEREKREKKYRAGGVR